MLVSPFTFYRGSALIMASDLAGSANSGITTQLCGDAHLMNFGIFASPERRLVVGINDFDETLPGPWEWDIKRLAASLAIAGRDNGYSAKQRARVLLTSLGGYRQAMHEFAGMSNLAVWYAHLDTATIVARLRLERDRALSKRAAATATKARTRDSMQAFDKLTHVVDGKRRIISDPPLIQPVEELFEGIDAERFMDWMQALLRDYGTTLQSDRRHLLEDFRLAHIARKVVGVGSVGSRAWILLMFGRDDADPLFLQAKEAQGFGARGVRRGRSPCLSWRTRGGGPAPHAGGQRHLPRVHPRRQHRTASSATSTCVNSATGRALRSSRP